jgi:hypothetical protein
VETDYTKTISSDQILWRVVLTSLSFAFLFPFLLLLWSQGWGSLKFLSEQKPLEGRTWAGNLLCTLGFSQDFVGRNTFKFLGLFFLSPYYCCTRNTMWHLQKFLQCIIVEFTLSIIHLHLPPCNFMVIF